MMTKDEREETKEEIATAKWRDELRYDADDMIAALDELDKKDVEIETIRRDAAREVEVARKAAEAWAKRARRVESTTGTAIDPLIPGGADLAGLAARESMSAPEPPPQPGKHDVATWLDRWLADHGTDDARALLAERVAFGLEKYGTRLQSHNGRDPLEDARQEIGDALQYVAQCHLEGRDIMPILRLIDALYDLVTKGAFSDMPQDEPTRLELQARGLLEGVEVGDWVIWGPGYTKPSEEQWPRQVERFALKGEDKWKAIYASDGPSGHGGGGGDSTFAPAEEWRLATPTELLNAGIIDEIPELATPQIKPGDAVRCTPNGRIGYVIDVEGDRASVAYMEDPLPDPTHSHPLSALERVTKEVEIAAAKAAAALNALEKCRACDGRGTIVKGPHLCERQEKCPTCDGLGKVHPDDQLIDPTLPVDANGEALEVGDLVIESGGGFFVSGKVCAITKTQDNGLVVAKAISDGCWNRLQPNILTKLTTLTHEQYLPLARRTLDPNMTDRERLSMLAMGCIGEWGELRYSIENGSTQDVLDECGDVLWYASILRDVTGKGEVKGFGFGTPVTHWVETAKKEIFHGKHTGFLNLMAGYILGSLEKTITDNGSTLSQIRYQNIRKLMKRYPDGFRATPCSSISS